jgi:hypothetical protein
MASAQREAEQLDSLFQALLRAGDDPQRLATEIEEHQPSEELLVALLRRPASPRLLRHLAETEPWRRQPRVLAAVTLNSRVERPLALRLLPALGWRDLASVAAGPWVHSALRQRAEALLVDGLRDLRLGERIALARLATPPVLSALLLDADAKVVRAALLNPRLRESALEVAIGRDLAPRALFEETVASSRWRDVYSVRLALILQPRTPLSLALAQVSALVKRDLRRVLAKDELSPLVHAVAQRLIEPPDSAEGRGDLGHPDSDPDP